LDGNGVNIVNHLLSLLNVIIQLVMSGFTIGLHILVGVDHTCVSRYILVEMSLAYNCYPIGASISIRLGANWTVVRQKRIANIGWIVAWQTFEGFTIGLNCYHHIGRHIYS
jgi:hypothetical protein